MEKKLDMSQFLGTFRDETKEHLQKLNQGLLSLEKEPENEELINDMFREAHTIKGGARMLGLGPIQELAHRLEDVLGQVREKRLRLNNQLSDLLFEGLDGIGALLEAALSGDPPGGPGPDLSDLGCRLVGAARQATKAEVAGKEEREEGEAREERQKEQEKGLKAKPERKVPASGSEETIRVSLDKLDRLLHLVGEVFTSKGRSGERLHRLKGLTSLAKETQRELSLFMENFQSIPELSELTQFPELLQRLYRCNNLSERLRDELGEFFTCFEQENLPLSLTIDELRERVMEVRMLPVGSIFSSFPRFVRDLSREQGKEITFEIKGEETELDKRILEGLSDPLLHIIRNCVDHGLESPEERKQVGKEPMGRMKLTASHRGGQILIEIEDDGRGIDPEKIRGVVREKGLLGERDLKGLSDKEIFSFIFTPGFSTRKSTTRLSGRGVGLDVVKTNIERLNGAIDLEAAVGKGTKFTLKLPLTLAITEVLLVKVSGQTLAIPVAWVEEVVAVRPEEVERLNGREVIRARKHRATLVKLSDILNLENGSASKIETLPVVVMGRDSRYLGLLVDELVGEEEVVVKNIESPWGPIKNVSGATRLPNGELVIILNGPDLAESALSLPKPIVELTEKEGKKRILVAEDSTTTRELERIILQTAGYEVETARDGLEAWEKLAKGKFDLVVSDIEMPRLNGLELIKRLKNEEKYKDIPVVVVSTVTEGAYRKKATQLGVQAYIGKGSFDQADLLDAVEMLIG